MSNPVNRLLDRFQPIVDDAIGDLRYLGAFKKKAIYIGCLGESNLGDKALFEVIQDIFSDALYFYSKKKPGVLAKRFWKQISPRLIMLGGGTLIKKDKDLYLGRLSRHINSFPNALKVVFGTGVGDMAMWSEFGVNTDIQGWREVLAKFDYIGVRGPMSKSFLEDWGVNKKINVIGDPAVWFTSPTIKQKSKSKKIGINFGPTNGLCYGQNEQALLDFVAEFVHFLDSNGWSITFFPMIKADLDFFEVAIRQVNVWNVNVHMDFLNIRKTLKALEEQDVFVGQKLHSVIFANCVSTPSFMIAYRSKCIDFMRSIEREDWIMKTSELNLDIMVDKLTCLYSSLDVHQANIHSNMLSLRSSLSTASTEIKNMTNNR